LKTPKHCLFCPEMVASASKIPVSFLESTHFWPNIQHFSGFRTDGIVQTTEIIICVPPPAGRGNTKNSSERTLPKQTLGLTIPAQWSIIFLNTPNAMKRILRLIPPAPREYASPAESACGRLAEGTALEQPLMRRAGLAPLQAVYEEISRAGGLESGWNRGAP